MWPAPLTIKDPEIAKLLNKSIFPAGPIGPWAPVSPWGPLGPNMPTSTTVLISFCKFTLFSSKSIVTELLDTLLVTTTFLLWSTKVIGFD